MFCFMAATIFEWVEMLRWPVTLLGCLALVAVLGINVKW